MSVVAALRGVCVEYPSAGGPVAVLHELDLDVRPGEVLAVIGPSGCGKTTLLHALLRLISPSSGKVEVPPNAAIVFQRPRLFPWRTAVENAAYGLECRGMDSRDAAERARHLLASFGLSGHLDDRPHRLSEGMKQRVNLARALLVEPRLLLMDEPFSALDAITRRRLQDDLLDHWSRSESSIVFVSHSMEEVLYMADRVAIMGPRPTGVRAVQDVELPRPRATDAAATLALLQKAQALQTLLP